MFGIGGFMPPAGWTPDPTLKELAEQLVERWRKETEDARTLAAESARMHFSGGSFERYMAVANLSKRHADELNAALCEGTKL